MSVTVDHEPLAAEKMGLQTVGQVLAHVQRDRRLVTNLLIDGQEPDLGQIGMVRAAPLRGRSIFIETADPRQIAREVLQAVEEQLGEADRLTADAADLLQRNQPGKAMEKLSGCFSIWHTAQESVLKVGQLMRVELESVRVSGALLPDFLRSFAGQLRQIRTALEHRDFVTLSDILSYEVVETSTQWRAALSALAGIVDR